MFDANPAGTGMGISSIASGFALFPAKAVIEKAYAINIKPIISFFVLTPAYLRVRPKTASQRTRILNPPAGASNAPMSIFEPCTRGLPAKSREENNVTSTPLLRKTPLIAGV